MVDGIKGGRKVKKAKILYFCDPIAVMRLS